MGKTVSFNMKSKQSNCYRIQNKTKRKEKKRKRDKLCFGVEFIIILAPHPPYDWRIDRSSLTLLQSVSLSLLRTSGEARLHDAPLVFHLHSILPAALVKLLIHSNSIPSIQSPLYRPFLLH